MKILAIGAHPDDIEIFMFGFLSACMDRGDTILLAVATDGSKGGVNLNNNLVKQRKLETQLGLSKLGKVKMLGFKDGNLHNENNAKEKIDDLIKTSDPDLILTHAPEDYHPDHSYLSKYIKAVAGFRCPLLFSDTLLGVNFIPEIYVDITKYFNYKKKAILCHKTQNPNNFVEAVEIMNRFRAAQCNAPRGNYAEAYRLDKKFPFSDIRGLLPCSPQYRPFYRNLKNSLI